MRHKNIDIRPVGVVHTSRMRSSHKDFVKIRPQQWRRGVCSSGGLWWEEEGVGFGTVQGHHCHGDGRHHHRFQRPPTLELVVMAVGWV
jgi:hypothetical protein